MLNFQIEELPITHLRPDPRNARTHSRHQIRQIAVSIENFGFVNPVLIDTADRIIAGHGRVEAAMLLGLQHVPVIRVAHLSDVQKRALAIADNKIALNAGWNVELLAEELQFLTEIDIDFDVTITGFETAEVDILIDDREPVSGNATEDEVPPITPGAAPVRAGPRH